VLGEPLFEPLEPKLSGTFLYVPSVQLGTLTLPEPVEIVVTSPVGVTVHPKLGSGSATGADSGDPVVEYLGPQGKRVEIRFLSGNFATNAFDDALEGLGDIRDLPGVEQLADIISSGAGLLSVWTMQLDEFIPQLDDLFYSIPPPWPIADADGQLLQHGITHVSPAGDWTMNPASALWTYEINIPLIRQSPETVSIFRKVPID